MKQPAEPVGGSDRLFLIGLSILGGSYIVLIIALLVADAAFTTPEALWASLQSREIQYAIRLSLISCSITAILSLWVAVPLGYLLSRFDFFGKRIVDALLDIPIVLPPLVIGLSLLILFQTPAGRAIERLTQNRMGEIFGFGILPLTVAALVGGIFFLIRPTGPAAAAGGGVTLLAMWILMRFTFLGARTQGWFQEAFATGITYQVPSVILAQFAVAAAFAVRTMRVTFDQITPRREQVALTLGCTRSQAFWWVVLPEARRGIVTAVTLSWARALGEFGPVLVFSGATRMKTEVLPTTVFLELSIGELHGAVAVSLLMVAAALVMLMIVRIFGLGRTG